MSKVGKWAHHETGGNPPPGAGFRRANAAMLFHDKARLRSAPAYGAASRFKAVVRDA